MFSRDTASNAARSEASGSSVPSRRSNRQSTSSSTKTGFLKKLLPGQWKSRSNNGDVELSNETWEQLGSLPEGIREEVCHFLCPLMLYLSHDSISVRTLLKPILSSSSCS